MAESIILICDVCGKPAEASVGIRVGGRNLVKDLCATHLRELTAGARAPKKGRRPGSNNSITTPKRRGRPKRSTSRRTAKTSSRKRTTRKAPANGRRKRTTRKRRTAASKS